MDWDDVRYFLALARLGSVRAAGIELGVSHSTVARRVESLEERLSARLFDRSRDGYTLTAAGEQVLPTAERVEREMAALEREVVGRDARLSGRVTVTCTDPFVSALLIEALAPFCREHPGIELSVTVDARSLDLARREADIALRATAADSSPAESLVGRKLAPLVMASYVATAHAERLDPEREGSEARWLSIEDPAMHDLLIGGSGYPDLPEWGSFCSLSLITQAARAGLGLALLPTYVGDADPQLQRLPRTRLRHLGDLWLVTHPDLRDNARFRATRAHIAQAFADLGPLFRGEGWSTDAPARPENTPQQPTDDDLDWTP
jgi:DNA-binding transcriptional LysR family regulator